MLPCPSSWIESPVSSKPARQGRTESRKLSRNAPAQQELMAVVVQPKSGRQPQSPARRQIPGDKRRQIMRFFRESEAGTIPQASVHLDASHEILPAETAAFGGGLQRQRPAYPHGISKLPGIAAGQRLDSPG